MILLTMKAAKYQFSSFLERERDKEIEMMMRIGESSALFHVCLNSLDIKYSSDSKRTQFGTGIQGQQVVFFLF